MTSIALWGLAYLWTASTALAISYFAGWQYDGNVGWWLVAAYSFPALVLASPLQWLAGNSDLGTTYCLIALATLTLVATLVLRRPAKLPDGS